MSVDPFLFFTSRALREEEKRKYNFDVAGFACEVTGVSRKATEEEFHDLLPGDIMYAVDGVEADAVTQNFETYIKLNTTAGNAFTAKLLRDGKPMEMRIWTGRQSFRK